MLYNAVKDLILALSRLDIRRYLLLLAGIPIRLNPFSTFILYLSGLDLNHHYSMHRMEQNEIRLSYRSVITNADPA